MIGANILKRNDDSGRAIRNENPCAAVVIDITVFDRNILVARNGRRQSNIDSVGTPSEDVAVLDD